MSLDATSEGVFAWTDHPLAGVVWWLRVQDHDGDSGCSNPRTADFFLFFIKKCNSF